MSQILQIGEPPIPLGDSAAAFHCCLRGVHAVLLPCGDCRRHADSGARCQFDLARHAVCQAARQVGEIVLRLISVHRFDSVDEMKRTPREWRNRTRARVGLSFLASVRAPGRAHNFIGSDSPGGKISD